MWQWLSSPFPFPGRTSPSHVSELSDGSGGQWFAARPAGRFSCSHTSEVAGVDEGIVSVGVVDGGTAGAAAGTGGAGAGGGAGVGAAGGRAGSGGSGR